MSVIHEALQRAERERSAKVAAGSATASPSPSPAGTARHILPRVAAVSGIAILAVAAALFFLRREQTPSPAPSTVAMVAPAVVSPPPDQVTALRSEASAPPLPAPAGEQDPQLLNARAVALFRAGRLEEARHLLEQTLRLEPAMPEAHNNFGMVLQAQGRRAEARGEFLSALALLPEYPEALNNLGLVWSEEGDQMEAIRSFEKALVLKPDFSRAHLNLAIVYDKLGKSPDAFRHYRRFLDTAGPEEQNLAGPVRDRLRR